MRNLFALLIFIPLFVSIKIPYTDWEWDLNFDWFDEFINNIKTGVPKFITNMQKDLKEFITKAESEKNKKINELKDLAITTYEGIKGKTDKIYDEFIQYTTQTVKYLSYKICDAADTDYEECRKNKKEVFRKIVGMIKDEFQCSSIVQIITEQILKEDVGESLKYVLFLVNSITSNPDAIEEETAKAVYDIIYCLQEKLDQNWDEISEKLKEKDKVIEFEKDITSLMIQSIENLVGIIHYEEIDEIIKKADEKTGLISSDSAKKIHERLFQMLQKLNDYGQGFYNLSATLAVKVAVKPTELNLDNKFELDFKEKGIKISVYGDYLFSLESGAKSLQAVVFDSPLVSVRGNRKTEGGTSNTFVDITLYGEDGKKLEIKDIELEKFRPVIYYKKKLYNALTTCLFYNEKGEKIENTGVDTIIETIKGEEYIKCIPKHLTSFTIGSYKSASISDKKNAGTIALVIILCLLVIAGGIAGFIFWRKRQSKINGSQMDQAFTNKDGLHK